MWRCGDNVLTIISTYLIFMQLQNQSWQILNLESYSFCPLIFLTLNWECQIIYKKSMWEKYFLWLIHDKCFFLRKRSHFFIAFVYFQCLVLFLLCSILITLESTGLSVSTVWLCCCLVLLLWCVFCQRKFTGTLAFLTSTMSHKALLRRNFHMLW